MLNRTITINNRLNQDLIALIIRYDIKLKLQHDTQYLKKYHYLYIEFKMIP